MAKSSTWASKWRSRGRKVTNGAKRVGRARSRVRKMRAGAARARKWATADYVCTACDPHILVRERDRKAHQRFHENLLGAGVKKIEKENVVARKERDERARKQSETVRKEKERRQQGPPPPPPSTLPGPTGQGPPPSPPSARDRARKSWADQVNHRRNVVAGTAAPANSQQRVAATGPAGHIQAAARMLIDFTPQNHGEQKELALSMNAVMGELSKAIEVYQENRVRERFHPNCVRPLDLVGSAIMECRAGWVNMILAIERHYSAHFEAARQGGPVPGQTQGPNYFDEAAG
jgi:hypothetical protein